MARLTHELRETSEQHAATSEILRVISSSPSDLQPVFQAMLKNAARLCDAKFGNIYRWDGDALHLVATQNVPAAFVQARGRSPLRPSPQTPTGRVIATKTMVHAADMRAEKAYADRDPYIVAGVELGGVRTALVVPMLKDDELIGTFSVYRQEVRPFTDKQIELVKNFAAQAVIAIENARLLNELRQRTTDLTERTADLTEALEQQTATSDVLKVISSSPADLQPVFDTMLANATRLCEATHGHVWTFDGEQMYAVAVRGDAPFVKWLQDHNPVRPIPGSAAERIVRGERFVHVTDRREEPAYRDNQTFRGLVDTSGIRASLSVALRKGDTLLGMINVYRQDVRPFTDNQIKLVEDFASQAVIAIENARLLNELRQRTTDLSQRTTELTEALEQQTATSEVLKVISSSPGELQPVFDAMLDKAVRICRADAASLFLYENGIVRRAARHSGVADVTMPIAPSAKSGTMRSIATKQTIHIANYLADPTYLEGDDFVVAAAQRLGIRASLHVPMLREQEVVGAFTIWRMEALAFTEKQIELVTNFAAQAVIAIENARLLGELRQRTTDLTEALDQQTATSEVLQVISSSPGDLHPVFATILENATRICEANFGNVYLWDGDAFHLVAAHNTPRAFADTRKREPFRPNTGHPFRSLAETKQVFHVADLMTLPIYQEGDPQIVEAVELGKMRTCLGVPMLKDENLIGAVLVFRQEVRQFSANQIALITNFAAQAVIAIENARLLKELRGRTEQVEAQSQELVKLNQQLEQRVSDQVGEIERMGRLRRFLPPQVADLIVASGGEKQLESHRREVTALFCDLRGFTGFTESADAEDVMALLREYHSTVGEKIIKYSGTLERYAGDGVMVVFNDPVPVENPALQAVLMALEMRDAIGALTGKWGRFGHDIGFGIGIAHGYATLGTIGFEGRFDYAAIGTVSNVASRLCDEAKPGQILISPRVLVAVEDAVKVEPVGEFELKGIRRPLAAYNVVAAATREM